MIYFNEEDQLSNNDHLLTHLFDNFFYIPPQNFYVNDRNDVRLLFFCINLLFSYYFGILFVLNYFKLLFFNLHYLRMF